MELHIVQKSNFNEQDFEFDETNRKVRLKTSQLKTYDGAFATNVRGNSSEGNRRRLSVKNGIGILHLDFFISATSGNTKILDLPSNAPTPNTLVELQVTRGNVTGSIWIDANGRTVWSKGLPLNTRIIVDLIGFFR